MSDDFKHWVNSLNALDDDKAELLRFEKNMVKLVTETVYQLDKKVRAALKSEDMKLDWTPYLDDFQIWNWTPGDLEKSIRDYLKKQIVEAIENKP